mmetsp:Transcript_35600/g.65130  ORF Transcript_35600/g.65130 Transcript_35600/m.65130 type:complete len:206 (-) Transcript_35600:164-781(-)
MPLSPKKKDMNTGSWARGNPNDLRGWQLYLSNSNFIWVRYMAWRFGLDESGSAFMRAVTNSSSGFITAILAELRMVPRATGSSKLRMPRVNAMMVAQYGRPEATWVISMPCITRWEGYHPRSAADTNAPPTSTAAAASGELATPRAVVAASATASTASGVATSSGTPPTPAPKSVPTVAAPSSLTGDSATAEAPKGSPTKLVATG